MCYFIDVQNYCSYFFSYHKHSIPYKEADVVCGIREGVVSGRVENHPVRLEEQEERYDFE